MSLLSSITDFLQALRGTNPTPLPDPSPPPTLTNKWIIITGSNNGVGLEACKLFAKWGANLLLACREQPPSWELTPASAVETCKDLAVAHGHTSTIEAWPLDLADFGSVEAFAKRWLLSGRVLDVLVNNAGIAADQGEETGDGFRVIYQVNFLSQTLLTLHLLPSLSRANNPRILCTTSCSHHFGIFDLDTLEPKQKQQQQRKGTNDYGNSKLFLQMWVAELQRRLDNHLEYNHITINGLHPGFVETGIWEGLRSVGKMSAGVAGLVRWFSVTARQGGLAVAVVAVGLEGKEGGGKYFNRVWEARAKFWSQDLEARGRLWGKVDEVLDLREKGLLGGLGG
ncbi:uncharacterized protein N7515_003189 [Penicillium bovifimosum]|uniref:NAD(P)-binding protein n=1 Tax=Penicillium bovifimosum TaxID=126998 RepID=A0A9W9H4M6_9EURO|nr:uncharacterized protein N7515_003189 [Penicillium bovifimosum]KAJ5138341.1 hypothetical protein N7515_003189 [Penicillium bovifimosum]